jgi:ribosomal protein L40E
VCSSDLPTRARLHEIIFEADTRADRWFDLVLIWSILISVAAVVMVMGYAIFAVPTGIVASEFTRSGRRVSTQVCRQCSAEGHDPDADHCKRCGAKL